MFRSDQEIKLKKISDFILLFISSLFFPAIVSAFLMSFRQTAFIAFFWLISAFVAYSHCLTTNCNLSFGAFFFFYYLTTSLAFFLAIVFSKESYS